jgi:response regulator RpfG family c-di-GMP phosphodiesterase
MRLYLINRSNPLVSIVNGKESSWNSYRMWIRSSVSPAEAVNITREDPGKIHLLMTDVVLPGMTGKELAGEIATICPATRTLFMSGYTADIIADRGRLHKG